MWILSFLPTWIFHAILVLGIVSIIVGKFLTVIPLVKSYSIPIRIIGYFLVILGIFLEGGLSNEEVWQTRVKEVEAKLAIAEQQSKEENVKIVNKVVTKTQVIRTRGNDIVKYVDREITKYDSKFAAGGQCEIPKEFIKAINDAAEAPK
jgi:hypothetical protein